MVAVTVLGGGGGGGGGVWCGVVARACARRASLVARGGLVVVRARARRGALLAVHAYAVALWQQQQPIAVRRGVFTPPLRRLLLLLPMFFCFPDVAAGFQIVAVVVAGGAAWVAAGP